MRILVLALGLLAACNRCAPSATSVLRIEDALLSVMDLPGASVVTAGTAGIALDGDGHVASPATETLYLTANDDQSDASADATPIATALAATRVDLRSARQALPAGTAFMLPASGEAYFAGLTVVKATVATDTTTPLTLLLDASNATNGVSTSGSAPYAYDATAPPVDDTCN